MSEIRSAYNKAFTPEKYEAFLKDIYETYSHQPKFRIAESPLFIPNDLKQRLIEACDEISDVIVRPDFMEITEKAIELRVPNEPNHSLFVQMDFGITKNADGDLIPKLIEVQGFPSLYFFQDLLAKAYRKNFVVPENVSSYFGGLNADSYIELLREKIVGNADPKSVILLEVDPIQQTTYIDFLAAEEKLGIKVLCVTDLKVDGKNLYYFDNEGARIKVERIFHRVIFDELDQRDDLKMEFDFTKEYNVEWVGHPNWFFRISKYTMPFLSDSQYVPKCYFLNELEKYPEDLENYVLKPLYSFAGMGVQLNVTKEILDEVEKPQNYILQEKVEYAAVVESPSDPVKCEIRMLMLWDGGDTRPYLVNNLARLSRGEMVGVRFNKDKDWVGGSVGFFEMD
jgi:glutathionylspermidine synthase